MTTVTVRSWTHQEMKERVLEIISRHEGWENAIKGPVIAEIVGVRDDRVIQIAIENLVGEGHVIAASVKEDKKTGQKMGYYLVNTLEQEFDYKHQLRSRALGNFHRYKSFKRACALRAEKPREYTQLSLFEGN